MPLESFKKTQTNTDLVLGAFKDSKGTKNQVCYGLCLLVWSVVVCVGLCRGEFFGLCVSVWSVLVCVGLCWSVWSVSFSITQKLAKLKIGQKNGKIENR